MIGAGHLGTIHAACLAGLGHQVVAVDCDAERVAQLRTGSAPFHEPGLDQLLVAGMSSGRLSFHTELEFVDDADVHFICVGTPQAIGAGRADLSFVWDVADSLAPRLRRPCLLVGRSTVPVGTAVTLRDRMRQTSPAGTAVDVAWNPEFLREGYAVSDFLHPDRLVLGVDEPSTAVLLEEIYAPLIADGVPVVRTDLATAELAKVSANAMLASRVSMVNLLAEVCERSGADVADLIRIVGLDHRIGADYLSPGVGFGGGCLPKDLRALVARGHELGVGTSLRLLVEVDRVNTHQRDRAVDVAAALLAEASDQPRVAVLGAAFKGGCDDVRDSPALSIASALRRRGAAVRVFDPQAMPNAHRAHPELSYAGSVTAACVAADLVMVLTDWPELAGIDPVALSATVRTPTVIDGRLLLDRDKWTAAGWQVYALGRPVR